MIKILFFNILNNDKILKKIFPNFNCVRNVFDMNNVLHRIFENLESFNDREG